MTERTVRLAILDSYGVRWTRETFARDLLQNFFDAATDFRTIAVDVRPEDGVVEIRGHALFDIDLLAYIGATTKTSGRTVGGFGEGFKICALIGTRDFGLTMTAGSGADEIAVTLEPVPLGRELCYRATRRDPPLEGSFVRLEGCDAACIAAFRAAPAMFRHPDNPKLGAPLFEDAAQGVAIYASPEGRSGELYYRRQLRGASSFYGTTDRAVTLAHDGIIDALEGDRDRRDLPPRPIARAIGEKLAPETLHRVLLHLMPYWRYGNEVLSGLIEAGIERKLRFEWPRRWLARASKTLGLTELAERQGFLIALASFADLGMRTPDENYGELVTRPADPLQRARIQVVADLYAELAGKRAKTTTFEVFDVEGAAVKGQHLGDKVIVGAELIAKGFDGVASTILHELAHEVGGEESTRFLLRLTRLLGAALRQPETVRAARRRYAAARPLPDAPAEPVAPPSKYDPGKGYAFFETRGVVCTLLVPPAFPPTTALLASLKAVSDELGIGLWVITEEVQGPLAAVKWRAPGLPTVWIGGVDPEPPAESERAFGYRPRSYGDDRVLPSEASLRAAILRAKEMGLLGNKGFQANLDITDGFRERTRDLLGVEIPKVKVNVKPAYAEREEAVEKKLEAYTGQGAFGGYELQDRWGMGLFGAGQILVRRYRRGRRKADEIWAEIKAILGKAIEQARVLRRADTDFDDADEIERAAMAAAQGVSVLAYASAPDDEQAKARATAHFQAVRALTTRVLDLDLTIRLKPSIIKHALKASWFKYGQPPRPIQLETFSAEAERAIARALTLQREADEEGHGVSDLGFEMELEGRSLKPTDNARREAAREAERSHAIKRAYDETLAAEGSVLRAAQRCMEESARLDPEDEA